MVFGDNPKKKRKDKHAPKGSSDNYIFITIFFIALFIGSLWIVNSHFNGLRQEVISTLEDYNITNINTVMQKYSESSKNDTDNALRPIVEDITTITTNINTIKADINNIEANISEFNKKDFTYNITITQEQINDAVTVAFKNIFFSPIVILVSLVSIAGGTILGMIISGIISGNIGYVFTKIYDGILKLRKNKKSSSED